VPSLVGAGRRILAVFGSLRLATVLLLLLTVACILGGLLPQAPITPNADLIYRSYGVFWYRLITRLRLDDVFHSPWFFALTGLFALNLALCTGRRAQRTLRNLLGRPRFTDLREGDAGVHVVRTIARGEGLMTALIDSAKRCGFSRVDQVRAGDRRVQLLAQRRRWGALGADIVHIGILVILAGALLGILREEGTLRVNEWEKGVRVSSCSGAAGEEPDEPCVRLPYDVRVDDFGVETYAETTRVRDFWATVTTWEGSRLLEEARVSVNRPASIRGVGLYVWRYGEDPSAALVRLHVLDRDRGVVTAEVELRIGETVPVPGTQLWTKSLQFYRTFALDDQGEAVDLGNTPGGHSAVLLQIAGLNDAGDETAYRDLALPFLPEANAEADVAFLLADTHLPAFIDLHYARNPGYPVFWWGFILVMVGLAVALYVRPATVRIGIEGDRVLLRAEGRGGRSRAERLASRISEDHGLDFEQEVDA